ncbi:MAG: 16S rRNA (guanine(527)-N(7))-methyltransferase RsmG [Chromatiales bacterium]
MDSTALWTRQLDTGLRELRLGPDADQRRRLLVYLALLEKWNRVFNLSAVRDPRELVSRHLLDSLAILSHLHGGRILDAGTGAGLPGIPLAVLSPERAFTLIDSSAKKTRFVRQATLELGLANVEVVTTRIEAYHPEEGFDTITARAFAPLADILGLTRRLLRPGGRVLAMKGPGAAAEVTAAALPAGRLRVLPLAVPGAAGGRWLVVVENG